MTIRISYSNKGARLDGPSTGSLLTELWVAARELDWGGAMLCLLRCPAGEDDIDIGGCVLEVLAAQVGVGRLLLRGGGVVLVLLPPRWWWDVVIFWRLSLFVSTTKIQTSIKVPSSRVCMSHKCSMYSTTKYCHSRRMWSKQYNHNG